MSAAPSTTARGAKTPETCPRCHTTQPWGQSSWCPSCSYYPVVDKGADSGTSWADDLPEVPQEEQVVECSPWQAIPGWFWLMLGGVVGIVVSSICIRVSFPDQYPRAYFALGQLALGFVCFLTAHLLAAKSAFRSDRRLNFTDVLLSWFAIWSPTIHRLPASCKRLWSLVWGIVACITAVTIIGGIDYSAPFRTHTAPKVKPLKLVGAVAAAAKAGAANGAQQDMSMEDAMADLTGQMDESGMLNAAGQNMSMEDALSELSDMPDKLKNGQFGDVDSLKDMLEEQSKLGQLPERSIECFIYGVQIDQKNVPKAFLMAANMSGQPQHIATIPAAELTKEVFRKLAVRLYPEVRKDSVVATDQSAVWVNPTIWCSLKFTKLTEDHALLDPKFDRILVRRLDRRDK